MLESIQQNWLFVTCGLIACVGVVAVSTALAFLISSGNSRTSTNWQQTAERTGLAMSGKVSQFSMPSLSGAFRGHPTSVYVEFHGGRPRRAYTIFKMTVANSRGVRLMISPHVSALYRLDYGLSLPEAVKTGDEGFDRDYVVRCLPPELAALAPRSDSLRQSLAAVKAVKVTFLVEANGQTVILQTPGHKDPPERMIAGLNLAAELAELIDG